DDRRDLNVAERTRPQPYRLTWLSIFLIADWQIQERARDKTMPCIVAGVCPLVAERIRVLWLFVDIRRRITCVRPCVAGRPRDFVGKATVQRNRHAVIRRGSGGLELEDSVPRRIQPLGTENGATQLLWSGRVDAKGRSVGHGENRRRREVDIHGPRKMMSR